MNILITICARGGSKSVKDKNIRKILNKPLISYTINAAVDWGNAKVICSTDSKKIADIAKKHKGICILHRPKPLGEDTTPKLEVVRHAALNAERIFKKKYQLIIDLDVTAPIRWLRDLDNCLSLYVHRKPEVILSVVKSRKNPYFNMLEENNEGYFELCKKKAFIPSRQQVPPVYDMNASINCFSRSFLLNKKNKAYTDSKKTLVYLMEDYAIDIDTELDLKYINFLMRGVT